MPYKNKEKERQNKKEYYQKNKEKIQERMKPYLKIWYQRNKRKRQQQIKEWYQKNKGKVRQYHKEYYQKSKEKILQQCKSYYQKNKKVVQQRHRKYNQKNKEKLLQYKEVWKKNKRKIDPKYRLNENIGSAISRCLVNEKAGQKWEILVDYSLEELIQHLERQFDIKMNWNNYGSYWVVDHIKPKSLFNFTSPDDLEFKQCWALENFQPLEKIENIKKRNNYIN